MAKHYYGCALRAGRYFARVYTWDETGNIKQDVYRGADPYTSAEAAIDRAAEYCEENGLDDAELDS